MRPTAVDEQLAKVVVRFGRAVHGRQVGERPLILVHFDEDRRRVVAVQRLVGLQVDGLLDRLHRLLELALPREAEAEVVERAGVLRVRRDGLLVE